MVSRQHTRSVAVLGITDRVFAGTGGNSVDGVGADFHWRRRSCFGFGRLRIALVKRLDRLLSAPGPDVARDEHGCPEAFGRDESCQTTIAHGSKRWRNRRKLWESHHSIRRHRLQEENVTFGNR